VGRAVAVLAVLAGVMAMHGLTTAHHGATAAPVVPAVLAAADVDAHAHAPVHAPVTPAAVVDTHDCGLLCQSGEHGLAMLCVAVLLAAAAGALRVRQRTGLLPRQTGPPRCLLPRTTAPPRSFDPVAELCTSRT
jgi:hypothetical protein